MDSSFKKFGEGQLNYGIRVNELDDSEVDLFASSYLVFAHNQLNQPKRSYSFMFE